MLQNQALSRVLAIQPVLDSIERDQAAPRAVFEQLKVGQSLTGLIRSQSNGLSLVELGGQTVAMRLPASAVPGDTLRLRFAGHMPQPVFLLETDDAAGADSPQLSKTARMLSEIMQRVPERTLPTLTPTTPLLGQAMTTPAELAFALRSALVRSGLFYESHLANWVAGQDTLDGLMQEPQNKAAEAARTAQAAVLNDGKGGELRTANPMHALLTQQLQVLESPQLAWRGELWPGQTLAWQIKRDAEERGDPAVSADEATQTRWTSHLTLDLPRLGTVDVYLALDDRQAFSIRMVPADAGVAPRLEAGSGQLRSQMAAAGCAIHHLAVEHDASA